MDTTQAAACKGAAGKGGRCMLCRESDASKSSENHMKVTLFRANPEDECAIYHEQIAIVSIDDLPSDWGESCGYTNAAESRCPAHTASTPLLSHSTFSHRT